MIKNNILTYYYLCSLLLYLSIIFIFMISVNLYIKFVKYKPRQKFKVIGITGLKYNGKDTVSDYLCKKYGYKKITLADPLKEICGTLFGFSHEQLYGSLKEVPDPRWFGLTPRTVFQYLGTDIFRNNMNKLHPNFEDNFWILHAKLKIEKILKKIKIHTL